MVVLGAPGAKWLKTFVSCKDALTLIRSPNLKSLASVASMFQTGTSRNEVKPPQLVSIPRTHRRYSLRIACGLANWLRSVLQDAALEPAPVVGITPRRSEVPPVHRPANTAQPPSDAPPPDPPTSPKHCQ